MTIPVFFIFHWYISAFCQTFFLHRYASHRMFHLSLFWERFFYAATFLTQGTSYLNPRTYALLHRLHHAHSDTPLDPHSPRFYRSPLGMMKNTLKQYLDIYSGKLRAEAYRKEGYPEWPAFDKIADGWLPRLVFAALYVAFYVRFADAAWQYLFLPLHFVMGPVHGAIVNWCGHKYGYANFDNRDQSKNTFPVDILTLGELMQNNHHHDTQRYNFAMRPFEVDPVFPVIRLLSHLGVVHPVEK